MRFYYTRAHARRILNSDESEFLFYEISDSDEVSVVLCDFRSSSDGIKTASLGLAAGIDRQACMQKAKCEAIQSAHFRQECIKIDLAIDCINSAAARANFWRNRSWAGVFDSVSECSSEFLGASSVLKAISSRTEILVRRLERFSMGGEDYYCYRVICPKLLRMVPDEVILREQMRSAGISFDEAILPHPFV